MLHCNASSNRIQTILSNNRTLSEQSNPSNSDHLCNCTISATSRRGYSRASIKTEHPVYTHAHASTHVRAPSVSRRITCLCPSAETKVPRLGAAACTDLRRRANVQATCSRVDRKLYGFSTGTGDLQLNPTPESLPPDPIFTSPGYLIPHGRCLGLNLPDCSRGPVNTLFMVFHRVCPCTHGKTRLSLV